MVFVPQVSAATDTLLPDEWTDVSVHRVFRNATYEIRILNRNPKGNAVIAVDGKAIDGDILPDFNDGKIHNVLVECRCRCG